MTSSQYEFGTQLHPSPGQVNLAGQEWEQSPEFEDNFKWERYFRILTVGVCQENLIPTHLEIVVINLVTGDPQTIPTVHLDYVQH